MSRHTEGTARLPGIDCSVGRSYSAEVEEGVRQLESDGPPCHHSYTGQPPQNLTDMERRVFDLIARRFIAVFYPDCLFATTTVIGEVEQIEFKVSGKQILGTRLACGIRHALGTVAGGKEEKGGEEENVLPAFVVEKSGPHLPDLYEKWTQPPRPYTEATLLRAMETAGKLVDNDELRDALKENGIGRPSTRAAIIETLFKRNYIRKEKRNLIATHGCGTDSDYPRRVVEICRTDGYMGKEVA